MTEKSIKESVIADSVVKSDGHQVLNNRNGTLDRGLNRNGTLDRGLNTQKRVSSLLKRLARVTSRSLLLE